MLKVISLFSGIGAFEKALTNTNTEYELVNFCEIDKYAVQAYIAIHEVDPSKNLRDITKVFTPLLLPFDLLTWGFPCQDISVAGKQAGMGEGTRSGLYKFGLDFIRQGRPRYSIIENVKALVQKKFKGEFDKILLDLETLGYNNYWKVLNAVDYGIPQNRERVFIVSIRKDVDDGLFSFPSARPLNICLADLLETDVDAKYTISPDKTEKLLAQLKDVDKYMEIANTITQNYWKGPTHDEITKCRRQLVIPVLTPDRVEKRQNDRRFKEDGDPAFTLIEQDRHGILTVVGSTEANGYESAKRVYDPAFCSASLVTHTGGGHDVKIYAQGIIRRLTPRECFRLMGFTDYDFYKCKALSDTQLYRMAGNSIVVNVLEAILKNLSPRGD